MKIVACSLSRNNDPCQTKTFKSFEKINQWSTEKIDFKIKGNNTTMGLSEYYNECIDKYSKTCDYMVFVHDDVEFVNMDLAFQLKKGFEKYDILGVAGCLNPAIKDMNLWHIMAERENLRGFASHTWEGTNDNMMVTVFGPSPSRVAMIDGVFMAVNCEKIIKSNTRFDEKFMFHHYDLDFSNTCNQKKLKIGTWPILINHSSPGLRSFSDSWKESNQYFKNKWTQILKN